MTFTFAYTITFRSTVLSSVKRESVPSTSALAIRIVQRIPHDHLDVKRTCKDPLVSAKKATWEHNPSQESKVITDNKQLNASIRNTSQHFHCPTNQFRRIKPKLFS
jgi:hypothetical protein